MECKAVFLDIGNVIVHLDYEAVLKRLQAACPLSREEIIGRIYSTSDVPLYESGRLSTPEFHRRMCRLLDFQCSLDDFEATWGSLFDPTPGHLLSAELFGRLKRNRPVIALSNTNEMHFSWLRKILPLVHEFDDYVLSFQVGSMKPDPGIFRQALGRVQAQPSEIVFVDDRPENIEAATAFGIQAIQFAGRSQLEEDLKRLGLEY